MDSPAPLSPGLGLAVMMNNYLHDVATALLVGSAVALWALLREHRADDGPGAGRYLLRAEARLRRLALVALGWIVLGGVPRAYFFESFEWANAVGKAQVPALVAKHVVIFLLVGLGAWGWRRLRRKVAEVRAAVG